MKNQKGFGLVAFMLLAALMGYAFSVVTPEFNNFKRVQRAIAKTEQDKSLSHATEQQIKTAFMTRAELEDLGVVEDNVRVKTGNRNSLRVVYDRAFHLVGNASLTFHFDTQSGHQAPVGMPDLSGLAMRARRSLAEANQQIFGG